MDNLQVSFTEETFDGLFQKATDIFETEDSADVDDQLLKGLAAHLPQLLEEKLPSAAPSVVPYSVSMSFGESI